MLVLNKTAKEVVAKHLQAIGGKEALLKHKSTHTKSKLEIPAQNITGDIEGFAAAPNKVLAKINGRSQAADEATARTGSENDLRNQTAELKGNFALVETLESNIRLFEQNSPLRDSESAGGPSSR